MRRNGYADHARIVGAHDGATGTERVTRRTSRRGHDHAVATQTVDMMAGHRDVELDHIGQRTAGKRHVVEGEGAHDILRTVFAHGHDIRGDGGATAHVQLTGQGVAHDLQDVALLGARSS